MISVVIFSGVVLVLAGLSFQVAKRTTRSTDQALSLSALQSGIDAVSVINYDSLGTLVGCDTTVHGGARVYRCIGVSQTTPRTTDVTLTIWTSAPGTDTTVFVYPRARERRAIPLR